MADRSSGDQADMTFAEQVNLARNLLGPRLVAYIASVNNTGIVHQWADPHKKKHREPPPETQRRVTEALTIALLLSDFDTPRIAQLWFQSLNQHLADQSPARLLREGDLDKVGPQVRAAALAFTKWW